MSSRSELRPKERRILALRDQGLSTAEIAERFDRSADHIERVIAWTEIPRSGGYRPRFAAAMGRRVIDLRAKGETHEEIGRRFKRGARYIRQVEGLAHLRRGLALLERPEA